MLLRMNYTGEDTKSVKEIIVCDSKGVLYESRPDFGDNPAKLRLARKTNRNNVQGHLMKLWWMPIYLSVLVWQMQLHKI